MKELKIELLKQIKINFMTSTCQVPWAFPLYSGYADTKNPLFRI